MAVSLAPSSTEETRAMVADALARGAPLEICGRGSLRGIGRPVNSGTVLSTSELSGVSLYEPEELVMRAGPGTPMEQIRLQLEQHGQMLAFEPPDFGRLFGSPAEQGTLAGIVATNLAGPRRVKSGAARDHFLGVEAVSGRGEIFHSGGRVVKNVTGYDLCKLMCGSWGTLAIMTELTLKVMPAAEKTRTVLVASPDAHHAVNVMTAALSSPHEVSAAAWLPLEIAVGSAVSLVSGTRQALVALRLEGIGASADFRCASLREDLASFGDLEELHTTNSKRLWRELRDACPFHHDHDSDIWRISVPPAAGGAIFEQFLGGLPARGWLDWGGGLLWLSVAGIDDSGASVIRDLVGRAGGQAMLLRSNRERRQNIGPFQPESEGVARLTRRIKEAFDPSGILNPGRMFAGV